MVNKTQFYKTKVALAVVLSLGLAACGDSEGDVSNSSSQTDSTQNTVENQTKLTADVTGTVVDDNANPIEGIAVYFNGDLETVTNAGGQYTFKDVAVANVVGVNNEGDEAQNSINYVESVITIGGTSEYLGALVAVNVEAQVNNTGGQGNNQGGTGTNSETTIQTFIDGFTASAGVATLPSLDAGAYGYVRSCQTGDRLTDSADILSLDFISTVTDLDNSVGNQLTNAEDTHTIGTDSEGEFSLTGLAANSVYSISAKEGWEIVTAHSSLIEDGQFTTNSEGSSEFLATIEVCPVDFDGRDITPGSPYISSVDGSIGTTTAADTYEHVVLTKGLDGTNGITLNFSEAISADGFDADDVVVTQAASTTNSSQTELTIATKGDGTPDVTLAADGMSLTVVLADPLADEQRFSIWFPQWQYEDNLGNDIVTGTSVAATAAELLSGPSASDILTDTGAGDVNGSLQFGIISDTISQQTTKVGYVRTRLCTYIAPPKTPEGLVGEQLVKTLDASLLAVGPLWDNDGDGDFTTGNVSNLNGQEDTVAGRDTGERLVNRFGGSVTNDLAVIVGSVQNATGLTAAVVPGTGAAIFAYGSPVINPDGTYSITADNTAHGTEVVITPSGAFGVSGTPVTVTLEDKVTPTTILQENYELWAIEADYASTTASAGTGSAGSGGEVTEGSITGDEGDPVIYIQPRHLTPTSSSNLAQRFTEFNAFDFATKLDNEGANDNPLYTGPAFAAWADRGNSLGVAFSETIATGSVAPLESASVPLALTGVINGLTSDIDGNLILGTVDTVGNTVIPKSGSDLARFTVGDMIAFANNDHNEAIDFTNGSIVDTQGNLANANSQARVVIRDAMPAFVTAARWDGSNLIITFNEEVSPKNNDDLVLTDLVNTATDYTLTLLSGASFPTEGAYSLNPAGDELTVAVDSSNVSTLFQNGPNNEFLFDSNGDTTDENHIALNWDDIEDAVGNTWSTFDRDVSFTNLGDTVDSDGDTVTDRQGRYVVDAPRFMLYNDVGIFTITKQTLGYDDAGTPGTDDDGIVTVRFSFSHPIDVLDDNDSTTPGDQRSDLRIALDAAQGPDYNGSLTLTAAQANDIFQYSVGGNAVLTDFANGASFAASFSADYKVISVTMHEAANTIAAGVSRIDFFDDNVNAAPLRVDSAITNEFLAAENYTIVNSN